MIRKNYRELLEFDPAWAQRARALAAKPLHHIVALRASTIVAYLEDYATQSCPSPRNANIITGASGTTDIEGSYVCGAHGPSFLHILRIES
jgi:L-lactate dehydrogenase complex protein LldG